MLGGLFKEGELKKLIIEAYDNPERQGLPIGTFVAMFNPEKYTKKYTVSYSKDSVKGNSGGKQTFQMIAPQDYTFPFLIDGTGASSEKKDVSKEIKTFLEVTGKYNGSLHRPPYLKIIWGDELFKGVLKDADISYTLFKPDGTPLRATIKATFAEDINDKLRQAIDKPSSPDLTHIRTVKEGDTLPLMTHRIYGDIGSFVEVAQANKLDNFRELKAGENIFFPPLTKADR